MTVSLVNYREYSLYSRCEAGMSVLDKADILSLLLSAVGMSSFRFLFKLFELKSFFQRGPLQVYLDKLCRNLINKIIFSTKTKE